MTPEELAVAEKMLMDKCLNYHLNKPRANNNCRNYSCQEMIDAIHAAVAAEGKACAAVLLSKPAKGKALWVADDAAAAIRARQGT